MAVLSFVKNKFPNFLSLSNTTTPSAPSIIHTKYGSKETTTQKIIEPTVLRRQKHKKKKARNFINENIFLVTNIIEFIY